MFAAIVATVGVLAVAVSIGAYALRKSGWADALSGVALGAAAVWTGLKGDSVTGWTAAVPVVLVLFAVSEVIWSMYQRGQTAARSSGD